MYEKTQQGGLEPIVIDGGIPAVWIAMLALCKMGNPGLFHPIYVELWGPTYIW